jgi:hypothetical protein
MMVFRVWNRNNLEVLVVIRGDRDYLEVFGLLQIKVNYFRRLFGLVLSEESLDLGL